MVEETKNFIIKSLNLEDMSIDDIDENVPLFNEGLGLDSVDALELGLNLSKIYGITLDPKSSDLKEHFKSVKVLSEFIQKKQDKIMTKDEIFEILKTNLVEIFELDEKIITLDAKIYEDLDIDSIDAIDLIDSIKKKTGYRLEPNDFKNVRTLGDIVEAVSAKVS